MGNRLPFDMEPKLPDWLRRGARVRIVANSNQHDYEVGSEAVVAQVDTTKGAFRARRLDGSELGNWLVLADVERVAPLGWEWLRRHLPAEDVVLLEAFDGLEMLELTEEVKTELISQVVDLKGAILSAVQSK